MNKLLKLLSIITLIPALLSGMESLNPQEKSFFERLPLDQQREILEYNVRHALHTHIANASEAQIAKLQEIIKTPESQGKNSSFDCKLLPKFVFTNHSFINICQYLMPKVLLEQETQDHINNRPFIILDFCKKKGLDISVRQIIKSLNLFSVKLDYEYYFPHFNGITPRGGGMGHLKENSDSHIYTVFHKTINSFLITKYCENPDPKIIDILKFTFKNGAYIQKDNFESLYDIAERYEHKPIIELLDKYKERILAQKSQGLDI